MNRPPQPCRLALRGEAGLACDENGLTLGGVELARLRRSSRGLARCEVRSPAEVGQLLEVAYGSQADVVIRRLHRGLARAAAWIEAGDLGRAGVEAVMLGLPDIAPGPMAKLARIANLEKAANRAWETEPRIPPKHTGGGRWTIGGGVPSAIKPASHVAVRGRRTRQLPYKPSSSRREGSAAGWSGRTQTGVVSTPDRSLLVHVNAITSVVGASGPARGFELPKNLAYLGRAGLLAAGAALLAQWSVASGSKQVATAISRFGLDASRPADVMAARAYVWSQYHLPICTRAPSIGPELDAASQAVMRFTLANPEIFGKLLQGSARQGEKLLSLVIDAANRGLADYGVESRARPPGVAPELQTTSRSARAAIASDLKDGEFQAHHLVPAVSWGKFIEITYLAKQAGWDVNAPSNLIALPASTTAQAEHSQFLPVHKGPHPEYIKATELLILKECAKYPEKLTPLQARSIFDEVARENREAIVGGAYGKILKWNL